MKCCNSAGVSTVNSTIVIVPHTHTHTRHTHTNRPDKKSNPVMISCNLPHKYSHGSRQCMKYSAAPTCSPTRNRNLFNWILLLDASWRVEVSPGYWEVSVKRTLLFWSVDSELRSQGETSALTLPLLCECKLTFDIYQCIISVIVVYMFIYNNWVEQLWVERKTPWWMWHIKGRMKLI